MFVLESLLKQSARAFILVFVSCLLLIACNEGTHLSTKSLALDTGALQSLIELNMQPMPALSKAKIVKLLGEPKAIEEVSFPNHHIKGQIDTIYIYTYDGLKFSVYQLSHSSKAFIIDILVTSPRYKTAFGLELGSRQKKVIKLLGEPNRSTATTATYLLSDSGDLLTLSYEKGQVVSMLWNFYWD